MREAKCVLVGGHSIRNPEPVYVFAVSGLVSQRHLLTNWNARPGDWLVPTKPLGTGTIARIGTERFPKTRRSILITLMPHSSSKTILICKTERLAQEAVVPSDKQTEHS
jgi:selenophosphate synthase